jgi:hypothetical protein
MKMINRQLLIDREGKRARKKDVAEAIARLQANDFQVAHAFTNELLEMAKLKREICDDAGQPLRKRRDVIMTPRAGIVVETPKPRPAAKKKVEAAIEELIRPAKFTRKERTELERFLKRERPEERIALKKDRKRGRIDIPTDVLRELLAELPIEEIEAPTPPRKILSSESRESLDIQTSALRDSSKKFENLWKALPEKKKNRDAPLTDAEAIALETAQTDLMIKLMSVLSVYKELEEEGFEMPRGRLISYGTKGKSRENDSFEKRVARASRALAVLPPDTDYPNVPLARLTNKDLRERIMSALNTSIQESLFEE